MVKLVAHLPANHEQTQKAPVQVQYAFALNRRNEAGDRDRALAILEKVGRGVLRPSTRPVHREDYEKAWV